MTATLKRGLGGISAAYYAKHLIFGVALSGLIFSRSALPGTLGRGEPMDLLIAGLLLVNALAYPFSWYVCRKIMSYFLWTDVFFVTNVRSLLLNLAAMTLCWIFAVVMAPLGLLYFSRYPDERAPS